MNKIGELPVSVLYDFCNVFPTVLHYFLFLVLSVLNVPVWFKNAIRICTLRFLFILLA